MDTVILAAGRGSRLEGIAPPFFKPFMIIDGKPLISRLVDQSREVTSGNIIVMASPENAQLLFQTIGSGLGNQFIMIQTRHMDTGPGQALKQALQFCQTDKTLVLMGDNIINTADIKKCVDIAVSQDDVVVGIAHKKWTEAHNFTRFRPEQFGEPAVWLEKQPFAESEQKGQTSCWIGPLVVNTKEMYRRILNGSPAAEEELLIGPFLDPHAVQIACDAHDIGIPGYFTQSGE